MSKSAANIGAAKERMARSESNVGLFEERLSMISKNRAMATKEKMEALTKLMEVVRTYGEIETMLKESEIESFDYKQIAAENVEKDDAKMTNAGNEFLMQLMGQMQQSQIKQGQQPAQPQGQMVG